MNVNDPTLPSSDQVLSLVCGELSSRRRWTYRLILLANAVVVAAILSLWTTEPGPLPLRLHVAFATMTCIGIGWICVLTWTLMRRNCPTAFDRIATAWMATIACLLSLAVSIATALLMGNVLAAFYLGATSVFLLGVALFILRGAYQLREKLRKKLTELESSVRTGVVPLVLVSLLICIGQANANEPLTLQKTTIKSRTGIEISADSGRFKVPLDRSNPEGPTIEIAFIRVRSEAAEPGPPTFILAGGPGDSGIKVVQGMFMGGNQIRSVLTGDVIGIDQRGSGVSKPNLAVTDLYAFPVDQPGDPKMYQSLMIQKCQEVESRFHRDGISLEPFNTIENATDVNALREQLGYKQVNLWGTSYGSQLALTILRHHESAVERVMIASPVGPDHLWKRPLHIQKCLERIGKEHPHLLEHMEQVLTRLKDRIVHVDVPDSITGKPVSVALSAFDIQTFTWFALGRIETTQQLPAAFEAMAAGDFIDAARWLMRFRMTAGPGSAMNHVMDAKSGCSDKRRSQIAQEADECLLGDIANFYDGELKQAAWNVSRLDDDFRLPVRSNRPVLILSGQFDAKTPVENAREILETLPKGYLGIIKNEGHGFRPRRDVLQVVAAFFRGDDLPREQQIGN